MIARKHLQKRDIDLTEGTMIPRWVRWTGYIMCGWSLIFAVMHFYWGAGGTFLFEEKPEIQVDASVWFLCAGCLCVIGILTVMALIQAQKKCFPSWLMQTICIGGGAILLIYLVYSFVVNGTYWLLAPGILCIIGTVIALALTQPWGQNVPRWLMLLFIWPGGVILTFHALYGFVVHGMVVVGLVTWTQIQQWVGAPVTPLSADAIKDLITKSMLIWNPWFLLGGILFLTIAWYASRRSSIAYTI